MTFVPAALACGHLLAGPGWYDVPAVGEHDVVRVDCPEGCGFQPFVVEPHDGEQRCLCQPGRHVCGDVVTVVVDLGERRAGDVVDLDFGD